MMKEIAIILLGGIPLGLAVVFLGLHFDIPYLNANQVWASNLTELLTKTLQWLKNNPLLTTIGSSLSTFMGSTLLWNKIHKTMKGELKQENLQAQSEAQAQIRKITSEKEQLAGQLEAVKNQATQVTELQEENENLQKQIADMESRVRDADIALKHVESPSIPEQIRRIERKGYEVHKKVP